DERTFQLAFEESTQGPRTGEFVQIVEIGPGPRRAVWEFLPIEGHYVGEHVVADTPSQGKLGPYLRLADDAVVNLLEQSCFAKLKRSPRAGVAHVPGDLSGFNHCANLAGRRPSRVDHKVNPVILPDQFTKRCLERIGRCAAPVGDHDLLAGRPTGRGASG